ncbi:hypothetical protein [Streptomyces sp. NPDC049906]|uniref:hypothetical protein n=1 Tax=Streptomyces sp. NPDC049906 TaxID=3155656 RepID=UPI003420653A
MAPRRESVPFAFVAETEGFRSNVAPPPRDRLSAGVVAGRTLIGLAVAAGLVGALVFGTPALSPDPSPARTQQSEATVDDR